MGICASSEITRNGETMNWAFTVTAKVIHLDGRLQQFSQRITASYILSQNPNCFLSNSEALHVDSRAPYVPDDEELELGQIYFLLPISKSRTPLSLQDLCALAIKATKALDNSTICPFVEENTIIEPQQYYRIPTGFKVVGFILYSQESHRNAGIN